MGGIAGEGWGDWGVGVRGSGVWRGGLAVGFGGGRGVWGGLGEGGSRLGGAGRVGGLAFRTNQSDDRSK